MSDRHRCSLLLLALTIIAVFPSAISSPASFRDWSQQNVFLSSKNNLKSESSQISQEVKSQKTVRYDGHVLLRFPEPKISIPFLQTISNFTLDVWGISTNYTDVFVPPELFQRLSANSELKFEILSTDIQSKIDKEAEMLRNRPLKPNLSDPTDWFSNYHTYDEITQWFKALAQQHPSLIEYIPSIGKTHEQRDIFAIKITNRNSNVENKSQFWIQGNQHAREWIGGATAQYISYQLVSLFDLDDQVTYLLNAGEFIIVPCMNPDGYVYTWEHDRLWRKNRRNNGDGSYGVDLNRNWPANWGKGGSSGYHFSDTYRGPKAGSEPEVKTLSEFFLNNPNIIVGLDLHCFSQLILRPIGWSHNAAPHEKQHKKVSDKMANIIKNVHGKTYVSEPSIALYPTTGSASDWFYLQRRRLTDNHFGGVHKLGAATEFRAYGLTIELRPTAEWWGPGFVLPPEQIIPTGEEIFPAIIYFMSYAIENILTDVNANN